MQDSPYIHETGMDKAHLHDTADRLLPPVVPVQEETSFDTRWPIEDYERRVFALYPELAEIDSLGREAIAITAGMCNELVEDDERIRKCDVAEALEELTESMTQSRCLARNLAMKMETPEAYVTVLYGAWQMAVSARQQLLPEDTPAVAELHHAVREGMVRTAPLFFREAQLLQLMNQRYNSYGHAEQAETLQLLLRPIAAEDEHNCRLYGILTNALCAETPENKGFTPMLDIIGRLKARQLDDALYTLAAGNPDYAPRTGSIQKLTAFVLDVLGDVAPEVSQADALQAMGARISSFTNGVGNELHWLRDRQLQFLEKNRYAVLKQVSLLPNSSDVEGMKAQLARVLENTMYDEEVAAGNLQPEQRRIVAKRRHQNKQVIRDIDKGAAVEVVAGNEVIPQRRRLVAVRSVPGGFEEVENEDAEFHIAALTSAYASRYPGTPKLEENLRAGIGYVQLADLSKGRYPGVKRLSYRLMFNGVPSNVYELKPDESPVPKNSRILQRTRTLFFLEENKLAILAIKHKDELNQYQKSIGAGVSKKG